MRLGMVHACLLLATALAAQQPPAQSLESLRSGPGLQTTLWASEPAVTNPTNITVDEPEGLLTPLSLQQVSDLLEFLSTQTGKRD